MYACRSNILQLFTVCPHIHDIKYLMARQLTNTVNFNNMQEPPHPPGSPNDREIEGLKRGAEFAKTGSAYAMEHGTRPSTIGFALASSPLALLAWQVA